MTAYHMIGLAGMASTVTHNAARPEYATLPYEKFFSLLLVICTLILVVGLVLRIVGRFLEQQRNEAACAARFEEEVMQELCRAGGVTDVPSLHTVSAPAAQPPSVESQSPAVFQSPPGTEKAEIEHPVAELINRLQAGGLCVGTEGSISLGQSSAQGQVIRLRDNKIALILPSYQSEQFLAQHARRFDLLFVLLSRDQVLVVQRYQDFVADRMLLD